MSTNPEDTKLKPGPKRPRKTRAAASDNGNENAYSQSSDPDQKKKRNLQAERQLDLQMELLQMVDPSRPEQVQRYSDTVDLYDALPKYDWEPAGADVPSQLVRYIEINGERYQVTVAPATIERDGKFVRVFPGIREQIVENSLRKFVAAGQYTVHGNEVGVRFTVDQILKEIAPLDHPYSRVEIREAIDILARARLELASENGDLIASTIFPSVMLSDDDMQSHLRFHPLVTRSIIHRI